MNYHGRKRNHDLAMDVKVIESFKGKIDRTIIRIWGDDGALCRPYVSNFPIHSEWILAIRYQREGSEKGDFAISSCGSHWLKVIKDKVIGEISKEGLKEEMGIQELKQKLLTAPNNSFKRTPPRASLRSPLRCAG